MKIGILGSGLMGAKLGTIFARAGHEVIFSYSRQRSKLERLAAAAAPNARPGSPAEAAQADVVLVAVHWLQIDDVLSQAGGLAGKLVITCCIPLDESNSGITTDRTTSGAEELAKRIPGARVVCAYNTVPSEVLFGVYETRNDQPRPQLVICGDDEQAKCTVWKLVQDTGFEPLDAGGLSVARYTEPFGMLVGELAYSGDCSPAMAYRFGFYPELNS